MLALGFFIFLYVFPPPTAAEQLADAEPSNLVPSGMFIHANPSDPVHYGKGRVSMYEHTVYLESDFEVGPGPAFYVYLVPKAAIRSTADLKDVMFVDLGGLRACDPGRDQSEGLSKRDHLVRALRRAHLARGFDDNHRSKVKSMPHVVATNSAGPRGPRAEPDALVVTVAPYVLASVQT